ncbi:type IV pilus assembly PilZ [Thermocrinis albus DSM 14484]|uniref:Type IV pilus assembly PilZ n=1 Tax=Thermocrinis albus (strain DSM 14484 / JCM 11386 / HI 11/12) TaxID=638303 RepID=D3SM24_THEAH|nr:PilZ domain-containing protein [Thermocrinis albus]ADC89804.1 type IV pilus assembly PilZ [Thermocrinis albus DSM 14484]
MNLYDLIGELREGGSVELLSQWKGVPVRVRMTIKWVSPEERFVSLDMKDCRFRHIFSSPSVYMKLKEVYIEASVFSNIRDELVVEVLGIAPPPPFVLREFVRVEPSDREPIYVNFWVHETEFVRAKVVDISEVGVGVLLTKEEAERLLTDLTPPHSLHKEVYLELYLPHSDTIRGLGELRNILSHQEGVYVRLGFRLEMEEKDKRKLRQYILRRQREILEDLRKL